jgi:phosphoenolpyruvate carboxylase
MRRRHGSRALGPYIISMAQGADDLLALLFLAKRAGLVVTDEAGSEQVDLDIAPLFETVDDLAARRRHRGRPAGRPGLPRAPAQRAATASW